MRRWYLWAKSLDLIFSRDDVSQYKKGIHTLHERKRGRKKQIHLAGLLKNKSVVTTLRSHMDPFDKKLWRMRTLRSRRGWRVFSNYNLGEEKEGGLQEFQHKFGVTVIVAGESFLIHPCILRLNSLLHWEPVFSLCFPQKDSPAQGWCIRLYPKPFCQSGTPPSPSRAPS